MKKYIDAEKLIAEIRKLRSESCISESDDYYEYAKSEIIDIIDSLQQEQSESDIEKEIYEYIAMEFGESWDGCVLVSRFDLVMMANHFYERGLKVRKEE